VLRGDPFHSDGSFVHFKSTVGGTAKRYHTNSRKGTGIKRPADGRSGRARRQERRTPGESNRGLHSTLLLHAFDKFHTFCTNPTNFS
jgi:hypothetical protein